MQDSISCINCSLVVSPLPAPLLDTSSPEPVGPLVVVGLWGVLGWLCRSVMVVVALGYFRGSGNVGVSCWSSLE